jgi:hypothetical protein
VRTTLITLVLVLAACGGSDRQDAPTTHGSSSAMRGPDNLVLRIPRTGGAARVYAYPRLDTVVWRAPAAPAPARILAFDDEAGTIAYVDARGQPARVDFRQNAAFTVTKSKVAGVESVDGSAIFAIAADGTVERYAPGGTWKWKPPVAARALFPQNDGTLLVLGERGSGSVMWLVRPPGGTIADSTTLPRVDRTLRTQVGDRLYLASGAQLTGVRTRTIERTPDVTFARPVELLAATPSGDRVFAVVREGTAIEIVDRYQERIGGRIELGRNIADLRVDPLGRYLLVRPEGSDSAVVVALGTSRVIGALATEWRADLPFVAPDGGIVLAQGADVIITDGETLRPTSRVRGGAADFWYPFRWTGFRPRAAALDRPVEFAGPPADSAAVDSLADSTAAAPPDSAARPATMYTVSFAALLAADKARELAAQIQVGDERARVVTAMRDGAAIFRVVMGPYSTREEAERVGRESKQSFWVYEGGP